MIRNLILAGLLASCCGGCGGDYILTVPDQAAPAGGEAPAVIRLQRNDFFVLAPAVEEAAMRYRVVRETGTEGAQRGAYTDDLGYAGALVPVPEEPGVYTLRVSHLDREGEEVVEEAPVYVFDPACPLVAVDMDALPSLGDPGPVAAALARLADEANLLYLTRRTVDRHESLHEDLAENGYPDGPVLLWQRQRWHIVREGTLRLPRIVIEEQLVSRLPELKQLFPELRYGLCRSQLAAEAFCAAGLTVVAVDAPGVKCPNMRRAEDWSDVTALPENPE